MASFSTTDSTRKSSRYIPPPKYMVRVHWTKDLLEPLGVTNSLCLATDLVQCMNKACMTLNMRPKVDYKNLSAFAKRHRPCFECTFATHEPAESIITAMVTGLAEYLSSAHKNVEHYRLSCEVAKEKSTTSSTRVRRTRGAVSSYCRPSIEFELLLNSSRGSFAQLHSETVEYEMSDERQVIPETTVLVQPSPPRSSPLIVMQETIQTETALVSDDDETKDVDEEIYLSAEEHLILPPTLPTSPYQVMDLTDASCPRVISMSDSSDDDSGREQEHVDVESLECNEPHELEQRVETTIAEGVVQQSTQDTEPIVQEHAQDTSEHCCAQSAVEEETQQDTPTSSSSSSSVEEPCETFPSVVTSPAQMADQLLVSLAHQAAQTMDQREIQQQSIQSQQRIDVHLSPPVAVQAVPPPLPVAVAWSPITYSAPVPHEPNFGPQPCAVMTQQTVHQHLAQPVVAMQPVLMPPLLAQSRPPPYVYRVHPDPAYPHCDVVERPQFDFYQEFQRLSAQTIPFRQQA